MIDTDRHEELALELADQLREREPKRFRSYSEALLEASRQVHEQEQTALLRAMQRPSTFADRPRASVALRDPQPDTQPDHEDLADRLAEKILATERGQFPTYREAVIEASARLRESENAVMADAIESARAPQSINMRRDSGASLPALQLTDTNVVEPRARTWNQIARVGRWEGHPQGDFEFTPHVFAQLVDNFKASENQRVPVDYEHASETLGGNVAQQGAPALAWVVALDNRKRDGLWALFEWVDPTAAEHVRAGRYMFVSPAVTFNSIDPVSGDDIGPRLTSVALTNHPFLDGMAPLQARDGGGGIEYDAPEDYAPKSWELSDEDRDVREMRAALETLRE